MIYVKNIDYGDEVFMLHSFIQDGKAVKAVCIDHGGLIRVMNAERTVVIEELLINQIKSTNEHFKYLDRIKLNGEDLA